MAARWVAHTAQEPPAGDWRTWLILAGRGFGKTRTGAEWVDRLAVASRGIRIALIGATANDARTVMVEGESGLLAVNPGISFEPSRRQLTWVNGARAFLFSAEEPETLRGPQFHYAWGDELARWPKGDGTLAMLRMGLRLGAQPRLLLTTTPKPLSWLKALATAAGVATTHGATGENYRNLPAAFIEGITSEYGGTALGRQELGGEFVEDREGALWTRALLERCRIDTAPRLFRVVIGVDPPAGTGAHVDACGIVVAGLAADGSAVVLADRSVQGLSPNNWARAVAAAADEFGADLVVAEANNGGAMVTTMLRDADHGLNIRAVHASVGKVARAEPVAARYERGQVRHAGCFPALEDELCGLIVGGGWLGPGRSPDRADALVWALTELLLGPKREPGVRML